MPKEIDEEEEFGQRYFLPLPQEKSNSDQTKAHIANSETIKRACEQRAYIQSTVQRGVGRGYLPQQPLLLQRKLGHPELIFNGARGKSLHFEAGAGAKWEIGERDSCWICQKWRYSIIFVDKKTVS